MQRNHFANLIRLTILAAIAAAAVALVANAKAAAGRPGTLDTTFGNAGTAFDTFRSSGFNGRLLVAPDGSLYAAAVELLPSGSTYGIRVDRFTADGVLVAHRTLTFPGVGVMSFVDAALAPNGDVIVVANGYDSIGRMIGGLLADLEPSLDLRPSFGQNGTEVLSPTGEWRADALVVQPSGEIGAVGDLPNAHGDPQLLELSATGSLELAVASPVFAPVADAAVAANGDVVVALDVGDAAVDLWRQPWGIASAVTAPVVHIPMFSGGVRAKLGHLALAPDGSAVVGGGDAPDGAYSPWVTPGSWLVRLTRQGALDTTFANGGGEDWVYNGGGDPTGLLVQSDGSIVMADVDGLAAQLKIWRVRPDGSADPSFGSSVALPVSSGFMAANDVVEQPNGRLVALTIVDDGRTYGFALTGFAGGNDDDLAFADAPPVTVEATAAYGAVATYSPPAATDGDGDATVNCTPASGSVFPLGTTTVTCTATDDDDTASPVKTSFPLTVRDTTPPALQLPSPITREATSAAGAVVAFPVVVSDLVDGSMAPQCVPASSSTFPLGTTTVTCTATDRAGNTARGSFPVTVRDTTPPRITLPPAPMSIEATGPDGASVAYAVSASDTVDGAVAVSCDPSSGSTLAVGSHTVACTATDSAGNVARASFRVDVVDTTPPVLHVPADLTVDATSPAGAPVSFVVSAVDLVDGAVAADCTPASGSTFAIGTTTVRCTAADSRGNGTAATFVVNVAGAMQQLAELDTYLSTIGPGASLVAKVHDAEDELGAGDVSTACGTVRGVANEAQAQSGKKLTAGQASHVVDAASRVRAVLACD
jgi:hypothetical protein